MHKPMLSMMMLILVAAVASAQTTDVEQEVLSRLDAIRSISVTTDDSLLARYNEQLDEAWTFFTDNKAEVLSILARELKAEREKAEPNDFLLLDIGYFVCVEGGEDALYRDEAGKALYTLNPEDEVVVANQRQLFLLVHRLAPDRDPRILKVIDRAFLYNADSYVFIPQHSMHLQTTLICAFLYGIYGQGAEEHLIGLLEDSAVADRVIEVLIWIGTDKSIDGVQKAMTADRDFDTFMRGLTYMMRSGGPAGRDLMLGIDIQDWDSASQQLYSEAVGSIRDVSYEELAETFARFPGDSVLSDDELKKRLSDMYDNYGKEDQTSPMAVINSNLPNEFLINELLRIRTRMFYRVSDEALSDVKLTNILINTLRFRSAP